MLRVLKQQKKNKQQDEKSSAKEGEIRKLKQHERWRVAIVREHFKNNK